MWIGVHVIIEHCFDMPAMNALGLSTLPLFTIFTIFSFSLWRLWIAKHWAVQLLWQLVSSAGSCQGNIQYCPFCLDTPGYPSDSRWWAGCFWPRRSFVLLTPPTLLLIGCRLDELAEEWILRSCWKAAGAGSAVRSRVGGVDQIFIVTVCHCLVSRRWIVLVLVASSAGRSSLSSVVI